MFLLYSGAQFFAHALDKMTWLIAVIYYIGSAEGHEYPNLQVGDEVNPRLFLL